MAVMVVCFIIAGLVLGITSYRRITSPDSYILADRHMGWFPIGASLLATILGSSGTLGLSGLAYGRGLTGSWWLLTGAVGLVVLSRFIPRIRDTRARTLPEVLSTWYGDGVRRMASGVIAISWVGIIGAQMSAAGVLVAGLLGGSHILWTVIMGAVFVAYTLLGGQYSVIRTDILQLMLILPGLVASVVWGVEAVGGFAALRQMAGPNHFNFPLSPEFRLGDLTHLLLVVGLTYVIGPDMFSRVLSASSTASSRRAVLGAAGVLVPVSFLIAFAGIVGRALVPDLSPAEHQTILSILIRSTLPPALATLLAAALLSAFLSSSDTTLLTMASTVAVDLRGIGSPRVGRLRLLTAACGIVSVAVGLFAGSVIRALLLAYSVFTGALGVPIVCGLAGRPMSRPAAGVCVVAGGALALTGRLLDIRVVSLLPFALGIGVWMVDALYTRAKSR